jgi:DNA polymerase III epsilon subunit-like protein
MPRILFFDTETNGLHYIKNPDGSRKKETLPSGKEIEVRPESYDTEDSVWPAILSICWKICDENGTEEKSVYKLIKPSNSLRTHVSTEKQGLQDWNSGAEEIHKITQANAERDGTSLGRILDDFMSDVLSCDLVVAHNLQFDKNVILNALEGRSSVYLPSAWPTEKEFCTLCKARAMADSRITMVGTPHVQVEH